MTNNYDKFQQENFLFGKDKKNPFVVPEGYFNSLSARLLNRIEVEEELAEFRKLASLKKPLTLSIPQNYFISLANILEYKYELSAYTELNKVAKPVLKPLLADYFNALDKKVLAQIELAEELKEFSVLSSIEKKNSFKVATEYFDTTTNEVKEKIHSSNERTPNILEQIISIIFKPKMAFALSFIVIIGFTFFWYLNKSNQTATPSGDCKTLACLEKNELLNENNIRDFDDENLYEMVDEEILDKQITKDSLKTNDPIIK
jgi:hypothetical protein